jgi:hypothetical protein
MSANLDVALGAIVFATAAGAAAWSTLLTVRFSRGGALMEAMMQRSFLPEKQHRYLSVLSVEGSMIFLSGLAWGLGALGLLPGWITQSLLAVFLTAASVCVGTLTWIGLRPSQLSRREQAALRNRALVSLVLAPMALTEA